MPIDLSTETGAFQLLACGYPVEANTLTLPKEKAVVSGKENNVLERKLGPSMSGDLRGSVQGMGNVTCEDKLVLYNEVIDLCCLRAGLNMSVRLPKSWPATLARETRADQ